MTSGASAGAPPPLIEAMALPGFYPHSPARVEMVQTHISWVFLAGDLVYKVKKPVDFGFLNFTTLARRGYYCRKELELNRRLAPDLYRAVVPIRVEGGAFHPGGRGKVVEYAVVMRRLPGNALLLDLLDSGTATPGMMAGLAELVADFHRRARAGPRVARFGGLATLRKNSEENFTQTLPYVGRTVTQDEYALISSYARDFLVRQKGLLLRRVSGGRIRDGHGDLHAEHVGWEKGRPFAMDCIEFTPRFRCADVTAEIAFLAMDLEYRGAWPLARAFLEGYCAASTDHEILPLLDYYLCYRACVRGKINSFLSDDRQAPEKVRRDAARKAARYFALAAGYARRDSRPFLVVTTGLTGTGKSTMATLLAERLSFAVVRSDEVRKRLAGIPPTERKLEDYHGGIYSPGMGEQTYAMLMEEGRRHLAAGRSVVLDATFGREKQRMEARAIAGSAGARFRLVETTLAEETVRERLAERMARGHSVSDGRWEVYLRQREEFEKPRGISPAEHLAIDTGRGLEERYAALLAVLYPLEPLQSG